MPEPEVGRSQISTTVLVVDRFGNVATNASRSHVDALGLASGARLEVRLALDRYYALLADTFADAGPGELIFYEDSYGLMTLAIMSRASLGHTGRPLVAPRAVALAYALLPLAALLRYLGSAWPEAHDPALLLAGGLWMAAFALFVVRLWPVWWAPRLPRAAAD